MLDFNAKDKKYFIRELCREVEKELVGKVNKMPEEWDGIELRWLIASKFSSCVMGDAKSYRSRKRKFTIECYNRNL